MRRDLCITAIWLLAWVLLTLAACVTQPETSPAPDVAIPLGTPVGASAQATAANQVATIAEIVRAYAQATLNSANATLSAAQTQQQDSANLFAAQIAATVEIVRANAQATLVAAGSTQSAALTQDAIRQTQMAALATQNAIATVTQQNNNFLAASTQTAVANNIATQTRAAAATSQWYADQARQREAQRQGPIAFLWTWCLPVFVVLLAGFVLWGFWRWLMLPQANQRILEKPVEKLQAPVVEVIHRQENDSLPYRQVHLFFLNVYC